jgi:hypothetical protein
MYLSSLCKADKDLQNLTRATFLASHPAASLSGGSRERLCTTRTSWPASRHSGIVSRLGIFGSHTMPLSECPHGHLREDILPQSLPRFRGQVQAGFNLVIYVQEADVQPATPFANLRCMVHLLSWKEGFRCPALLVERGLKRSWSQVPVRCRFFPSPRSSQYHV